MVRIPLAPTLVVVISEQLRQCPGHLPSMLRFYWNTYLLGGTALA